jgi:hypothetical protein
MLLLFPASAAASMNKTLDISVQASRMQTADWDANGGGMRLGNTFSPLRYGGGVSGYRPEVPGRALLMSYEVFYAYAPGGYFHVRPFVEVRFHIDNTRLGDDSKVRFAVGARIGAIVPINEYFFVDAGIGRDVIGADTMRATIGIGLPIPVSHL